MYIYFFVLFLQSVLTKLPSKLNNNIIAIIGDSIGTGFGTPKGGGYPE